MNKLTGTLYIISTPIGNLNDISLRALETLFKIDILLCEDTRVTGKLLQRCKGLWSLNYFNCHPELARLPARQDSGFREIPDQARLAIASAKRVRNDKKKYLQMKNPQLISYFDHNEERMNPQIINWLGEGKDIGLVTDAGTPLISDPGYKLVRECLNQNIKVESIPGASSFLTALTLSSFPPDKFMFIGYLPRKSGQRQNLFKKIKPTPFKHITVIAFESPHRLGSSLQDLQEALGNIEICVCRELTKMYEEVKKGKVSDVIEYFKKEKVKGEIVILFAI